MRFLYILRCADGSFCIGETTDIDRRLAKHNEGVAAVHTAQRRPVKLVYTEQYATREACLQRERQLKRWTRAKKEALVAGDKVTLKKL